MLHVLWNQNLTYAAIGNNSINLLYLVGDEGSYESLILYTYKPLFYTNVVILHII
jgi:hypothetical protein